eukprot:114117_1
MTQLNALSLSTATNIEVSRRPGPGNTQLLSDYCRRKVVELCDKMWNTQASADAVEAKESDMDVVPKLRIDFIKKTLSTYITEKMNSCASNLDALIGEMVGVRRISHAGSLTNISTMHAFAMQILGAEKALFRALKMRGNTPKKYGLIFHSSFIQRAGANNKDAAPYYFKHIH